MIRQVQGPALVWETDKVHAADKVHASLKVAHLVATSGLRTKRAEWVDRHVITLHENKALYEQLGKLRATGAMAENQHRDTEVYVAKPRNDAKNHASNVEGGLIKLRHAHTIVINDLKNVCTAAATASHTIATELQRIATGLNCAQAQSGESHQNTLKTRDDEVKLEFRASASEMIQIKCALELEQVRYAHLGKILANYEKRHSPAKNASV